MTPSGQNAPARGTKPKPSHRGKKNGHGSVPTKTRTRFTFRLPPFIVKGLEDEAIKEDRPINQIVKSVLSKRYSKVKLEAAA